MHRLIPILIVLLAAFSADAADPSAQPILLDVSSEKAAFDAAVGKDVIVQGIVSTAAWSTSGKVLNIEFKNAEKSRFLAVLFERNRSRIDEGFNGDVAKTLVGRSVRIHGALELYAGDVQAMKDRPQIVVLLGDQITIIESN